MVCRSFSEPRASNRLRPAGRDTAQFNSGLERAHKHKDPTNYGFWNPALSWALKPNCRILIFICGFCPCERQVVRPEKSVSSFLRWRQAAFPLQLFLGKLAGTSNTFQGFPDPCHTQTTDSLQLHLVTLNPGAEDSRKLATKTSFMQTVML